MDTAPSLNPCDQSCAKSFSSDKAVKSCVSVISFYQSEEWRVKSEDNETFSLSLHSAISTLHFFYITLSPSGSVNNSLSGVSVLSSLTVTLRVSVSPS